MTECYEKRLTIPELAKALKEGEYPVCGMLNREGAYLFGGRRHPNACLGQVGFKTLRHIQRFHPSIEIK